MSLSPLEGSDTQYSGQGDSYYNGMTFSIQHRSSGWLTARLSYTLSKTIDNAGNALHDPWKNNPVKKFNVVHEKLFHAFIVSEDLQVFVHDHPVWMTDAFQYDMIFPKPGMYRVLADFYPEGATPQLVAGTIFVQGNSPAPVRLTRDYSSKSAENLKVELVTAPAQPVAGTNTQLRFTLSPGDGIQKYLGAWGHMLAASDDLIDMIHTHPLLGDGSPEIQFDLTFPRARTYRVWVQFQRNGIVNTVHFDVPVKVPVS